MDGEAGVAPGEQELGPLVAQQTRLLQQADDLVAEEELCRVFVDVRNRDPLPAVCPPSA